MEIHIVWLLVGIVSLEMILVSMVLFFLFPFSAACVQVKSCA